MRIRRTEVGDLGRVMEIYAKARNLMVANGNATQWVDGYPSREVIERDMAKGNSYVCLDDEQIVAVFYFGVEADPTYAVIYEGAWLNEQPYGVVHRMAVDATKKGTATFCMEWCYDQAGNIRVDTHQDNKAMQRVLEKCGYAVCGRIVVANGTSRVAYQKQRGGDL